MHCPSLPYTHQPPSNGQKTKTLQPCVVWHSWQHLAISLTLGSSPTTSPAALVLGSKTHPLMFTLGACASFGAGGGLFAPPPDAGGSSVGGGSVPPETAAGSGGGEDADCAGGSEVGAGAGELEVDGSGLDPVPAGCCPLSCWPMEVGRATQQVQDAIETRASSVMFRIVTETQTNTPWTAA
jgi:hypothetical protein